ncbi:MAG: aldose 1-epimerase [Solirubrobacteraceae bacterium]|nr:aldose 1-epimerase [Solirubrobacteraceae bacterium]
MPFAADLQPVTLTDAEHGLTATVLPGAGMLIPSLQADGIELLGQRRGIDAYLSDGKTMGIPLLYPWANRVGEERFDVAGVALDLRGDRPGLRRDPHGLPIHGLLAAHPGWVVKETTTTSLTATFAFDETSHPELAATWPFPHVLTYEVTLRGGALELALTITPTADASVPVAHGLHPYVAIPGTARADWHVELPARRHLALDEQGLPTGGATDEPASAGALADRAFDDAYDGLAVGAEFVVAGGGWELRTTFVEGYPAGQVFAPPADPVICFEPMAAPTNALVAGNGLRVVAPGSSDRSVMRIDVSR